jgi:hypothetical protein
MVLCTHRGSLEGSYSVGQRDEDVGRATKEAEGVVEIEDRYAVFSLCVARWGARRRN